MARNSFRKLRIIMVACFCIMGNLFVASSTKNVVTTTGISEATSTHLKTDITMNENQNLTQMWDKVFPQSDKVNHSKVTFRNRYGITLVADLYIPKNATGHRRLRSVRCRKGTVVGPLCPDTCRARIPDYCIRSFVYGRE